MTLRLATSASIGLFHDDAALPAALAAHGIDAIPCDWRELEGPDPVLIRTPWDYTTDVPGFLGMFDRLDAAGAQFINPTDLMRWNLDKRYLLELEDAGHAIVPTRILDRFDASAVADIADEEGWARAIAKPVQGAGAEGLVVVDPDGRIGEFDPAGNTWAADTPRAPIGPCLVQPMMDAIHDGEWSLFFFGGDYSHSVLKRPGEGDIRVQEEHGGTTAPATPAANVRSAAQAIVDERPDAVYARVDGVVQDGRLLLMELELIEPELYFRYAPGAVGRFATAVADALR